MNKIQLYQKRLKNKTVGANIKRRGLLGMQRRVSGKPHYKIIRCPSKEGSQVKAYPTGAEISPCRIIIKSLERFIRLSCLRLLLALAERT